MRMAGLALAVVLALVASVQCEIELEEGVLVLTNDNFDGAVESNSLLLVEFYAPWCGHCKNLAPEYAAAAGKLAEADSPIKLAKVDATEHKELGTKFGVKGFPTLKFFKNGEPMDYTGGRTADTIIAWVTKKSGPAAVTIETVEAAEKLIEDNKVMVIGFFKDAESDNAKAFLKAADSLDDQVFGITSEDAVLSKYEAKDGTVSLFKKFDEGRNDLDGEMTDEIVVGFVNKNSLPLVVDFNQNTAQKIFGSGIEAHFIMFGSAKDDDYTNRYELARTFAKENKGELMFVSVTTDEAEHKRVLDFFGIQEADTPTFRICRAAEDFIKYKPASSEFSEDNLKSFIASYKAGEIDPDLKTEDVPEDWDAAPVKILVGKNFDEVALDSNKDVFVEFYAPWCGHCKNLAPIWDELGEKMKDEEDIVIAKMDSTANEVMNVKIRSFPTLKLFKKDGTVEDYKGGRTLNDFVKYLKPEQEEEKEPEAEADAEAKKDEL